MHIEKIIISARQNEPKNVVFNGRSAVVSGDDSKNKWLQAVPWALNYSNQSGFQLNKFNNFNGSIEIIFNDSNDGPNKKQISIRRSKIDDKIEYFLDTASVQRIDVKNFISNSGFSKSYPFQYFVQRTDLDAIVNGDTKMRLQFLLDCCGLDDFSKSREKSLRILTEADNHIEKIDLSLGKIDVQLKIFALDENQKIHQEWVKREKELGHTQNKFRIQKLQNDIKNADCHISTCSMMMEQVAKEITGSANELKSARNHIKTLTTKIQAQKGQQQQMKSHILKLDAGRNQLDRSIVGLKDDLLRDRTVEKHTEREKRLYRQSLSESESESTDMEMEVVRLDQEEEETRQKIGELESQRDAVIINCEQNQRLNGQYLSVEERDEAIAGEIQKFRNAMKNDMRKVKKLKTELEMETTNVLGKLNSTAEITANKLNNLNGGDINEVIEIQQKMRTELQMRLNQQKRECDELTKEFNAKNLELMAIDGELRAGMKTSLFNGLRSMQTVMKTNCPDELKERYFGVVVDNFTCDESLRSTFAILFGEYLFYHIVDTQQTALEIIKRFNERSHPGEVSFFSLNSVNEMEYGGNQQLDHAAILNRMKFDEKFRKMFVNICRKSIHCQPALADLSITPESSDVPFEYFSQEGAMVASSNRMAKVIEQYEIRNNLTDIIDGMKHDLREAVFRKEALSLQLDGIVKALEEQHKIATETGHLKRSLNSTNSQIEVSEGKIRAKQKAVDEHETQIQQLTKSIECLEFELKQPFLSNEETESVETFSCEIEEKKRELKQIADRSKGLQKELQCVRESQRDLRRRYSELETQSSIHLDHSSQLEHQQREKERLDDELSASSVSLESLKSGAIQLNQEVATIKSEIVHLTEKKRIATNKQAEFYCQMNTLKLQKKALTDELNTLCAQAVRNGEITNSDIIDMSEEDVNVQLRMAQHQLKTFAETNQFDLNLLERFTKDKKEMQTKRTGLIRLRSRITEAIQKTVADIDDSIENTFKHLAECFSTIFSKIIGNGGARLELICSTNGSNGIQIGDISVRYTGLEIILVGENEKSFVDFSHLEKTLMALIFVFSLQRLNPAPFYLFDGVIEDSLDEHIASLIGYLNEVALRAQVIVATNQQDLIKWAKSHDKILHTEF